MGLESWLLGLSLFREKMSNDILNIDHFVLIHISNQIKNDRYPALVLLAKRPTIAHLNQLC